MERLYMDLIGERIRVDCAEASVREGVIEAAPLLECPPFAEAPGLAYSFRTRSPGEPLPDLSSCRCDGVSAAQDFVFWRSGSERWLVVEGKSAARILLEEGRIDVLIDPEHLRDSWTIGHRLFFLPLLEWMRYRGRYPLHGSCFVSKGRGVIVCGPSGAGKSSATLSAIASGCPFVADDTLFMLRKDGSVVLNPFPEPLKVGEGTSRFFPGLKDRLIPKNRKLLLPEDALPPPGRITEARPEVLLFPEIVDRARSRFERLPDSEAMARLLPQSVLPADREQVEAHIAILADLVSQVAAYRLLFGRDLPELPARVSELAGGEVE
ncbi:MAG: hypothetical protein ABIH26_02210 [Candidatus Eisenbacteria bacterium]